MDLIVVLIVAAVSGLIGFYVGKKKPVVIETKVVEREPEVRVHPIELSSISRSRYRVESPEGEFSGDSASASEKITKLRAMGKHGKLYLDDKLAKEF